MRNRQFSDGQHAGLTESGSKLPHSKEPLALQSTQYTQHADPFRAVARAVSAARTEDFAKLLRIDAELVIDSLALPRGLVGARIMAGSVEREHAELARIPVPGAHSALDIALVHDIETVAGGAGVCTSAATQAGQGLRRPEGAIEIVFYEGPHRGRVEALLRP